MAGPDAAWDDPMTDRAKVLMAVVALSHDPTILAAVAAGLGAAGLAAAWLPARSAARVDPAEVLRSE